ncbi:unnamed protein product [Microthlaspi erraticum]|uniref:Reverse transcriptase zinc-binding domain-containing protein n=1 Tax=Microthlaspi erraticum TaxID=1685480 RepID=A0A6D2I664_9BRAS|nr:unnamed protein product [Microthlaspi erraticum]
MRMDPQCVRCGMGDETINHMLFECPPARQAWALSPIPTPSEHFPTDALYSNMAHLFWNLPDNDDMLIFPWLLWFIWKARNSKVFSNDDHNPQDVLESAIMEARAWAAAQTVTERVNINSFTQASPAPLGEWCQIDRAWKVTECRAGLGCMLVHNKRRMNFQTDCAQLVKMVSKPTELPAFAILLEEVAKCRGMFQAFSLTYIPDSSSAPRCVLHKLSSTDSASRPDLGT